VSILDVVSPHVTLRRSGRRYVGLCPFHNDKTPSFSVNAERGYFHCFGCGAGGTLFDLASALLGGPTGHQLRGDAFKRARAYVVEVLGQDVKP